MSVVTRESDRDDANASQLGDKQLHTIKDELRAALHSSISEYRAGQLYDSQSSVIETVKEPTLVFAHGAGASSQSDWMIRVVKLLSANGLRVITFDFPYMSKQQCDGRKRPPDRQPILLAAFVEVISRVPSPCWIGGKSMGGRMASIIAAMVEQQPQLLAGLSQHFAIDLNQQIKGCGCFGYPFYSMGKADRPRIDHLQNISRPIVIYQGSRDAMGRCEQVSGYTLSPQIIINWLEEGDHDFKPTKTSGLAHEDHLQSAAKSFADYCRHYD